MNALLAGLALTGLLIGPNQASSQNRTSALETRIAHLERTYSERHGDSAFHGSVTIGRSAQGRPISLEEYGFDDSGQQVLVFGCIEGPGCAGSTISKFQYGCPTPGAVFYARNLTPDGRARTRLAARLVRVVRPDITIWFHQGAEPMVRGWGPSVPQARRFARYVRGLRHTALPFRRLPWLTTTAPNWQNHRFPGTAAFVVELPPDPLPHDDAQRIGGAIARLVGYRPRDL